MRGVPVAVLALFAAACASSQPDRLRAFNEDGVYLFERGAYQQARDNFEAALALQPGDPNLQYNVAQCADRLGDRELAEQGYRACLEKSPDHAECRHALSALLVKSNRRDDAVRMVESWLASRPKLAAAYAEDGWLWRQYGDLPRAQARLQQALEVDPRDVRTLFELAEVYEQMSRPDRALALYERVLEVKPGYAPAVARATHLRAKGVGRPHPD